MWKVIFELVLWIIGAIMLVSTIGWAGAGGVVIWLWSNNMQMLRLWREDIMKINNKY